MGGRRRSTWATVMSAVMLVVAAAGIPATVSDAAPAFPGSGAGGSVTLETVELNNDGFAVTWSASPPPDAVSEQYDLYCGDGFQTLGYAGLLSPGESPVQIGPVCGQHVLFFIQAQGARPIPDMPGGFEAWVTYSEWVPITPPLDPPTVTVADVTAAVVTLNITPPSLPSGATVWGYRVHGTLPNGLTAFVQDFGPVGGQSPTGRLEVQNCGTPCSYIVLALIGNPASLQHTWASPFSEAVTSLNQVPSAFSQSVATWRDTPVVISLDGSDPDGDALSFEVTGGPAHGTLTWVGATRTYTPVSGYVGTDTFSFVVSDGQATSQPAVVSITVNAPPNQVPSAFSQSVATWRDTPVVISLDGSDPDGDALSFEVTGGPAHGTLTWVGATRTYTPVSGYVGTDTFSFVASDGQATSQPAVVSITVNAPPNQVPSAFSQSVATWRDTPVVISLDGSDPDGDALSFEVTGGPAHGTLTWVGATRTYTPVSGYVGTDTFSFVASDGQATSQPAVVSITVNAPPNQVPSAFSQSVATWRDTPVVISLDGSDPDGDALSFEVTGGPAHGTLTWVGATRTYTPVSGYVGTDTFSFVASDGQATSQPAVVSITVNAPPNPPMPAREIVFASDRAGQGDIYVMNANGSGVTRLTTDRSIDGDPSWSPDGTKIAFTSTRTGLGDIYVMNADGSGVTRLTTDRSIDGDPSWSPDGTKIAFTSTRTGLGDIYVMNADGSGVTRLTTDRSIDGDPSWSPDGTKIAFTSTRTGLGDIYVMNADGSGVTRLTTDRSIDGDPSWSPDGTKIAFTSTRTGLGDIYVMNADGSGVTRLTTDRSIDGDPSWSPDGTKIAFTSTRTGLGDIYVMNADGSGVTRLTTNRAADRSPDW